jgi:hypothetical protein
MTAGEVSLSERQSGKETTCGFLQVDVALTRC